MIERGSCCSYSEGPYFCGYLGLAVWRNDNALVSINEVNLG